MKKSILLGCIAACALLSTTAFAEVIKPTSAEVKTAFTEFLNNQSKVGTLFSLDQMKVKAKGKGFDITLPAVKNENVDIQSKKMRLTYAGEFNNHAQYKIESPFESVQSLFKDILPNATLNAESANVTTIWVPAYNFVSKNSQNIKGFNLSIPGMMKFSADSLVSDSLAQVVSPDKMNMAESSDGKNIEITAEGSVIVVPTFSYESVLEGSAITDDPFKQVSSCTKNQFKYTIPEVQLKMQGASASMASFSLEGMGVYQNEIFHFENKIGHILSPTLGAFAPAALLPDEISLDINVEGIERGTLTQLLSKAQTAAYTDEDVPAFKRAIETGVVKINRLEVKNGIAGIALSGSVRGKLKDPEKVTTMMGIRTNLTTVVEAKVVITNLDKISPEPKINEEQCEQATERLNNIDMSAPNSAMQKEMAEMQQEHACAPQGGPLDIIRPYLDKNNRVIAADGTTTDTFVITYEDDILTVNGKQIQ